MSKYFSGFFVMSVRNENEKMSYTNPTHKTVNVFLYGRTLEELACSFYLQLLEDGWQILSKQSEFENGWYDGLLAYDNLHEIKRIDIILSRSIMIGVHPKIVEALLINLKDIHVKICTVIDEKKLRKKHVKNAIKKCLELRLFADFLFQIQDSQYLIEQENFNENDNGILKIK